MQYIAFSYNFAADLDYVETLANSLEAKGVPTWYMPALAESEAESSEELLSGDFDWRSEPQNWHALFAERLYEADGIVVVLSPEARLSRGTLGRGMWRESAAVEFVRQDNPTRVREIERTGEPSEAFVGDLAEWCRAVLALPAVARRSIGDPNAFNIPTGETGPVQLPERKSSPTDWHELVRLDLYDVEWHCRRCSLKSHRYVMAHEDPPAHCPRCGFSSTEPERNERGLSRLGTTAGESSVAPDVLAAVLASMEILELGERAKESQNAGRHEEAMEINFRLERACRKAGVMEPVAEAFFDQAIELHKSGRLGRAMELYGHAERLLREMGHWVGLQHCLRHLGTILSRYNRLDLALARHEEHERLSRTLGDELGLERALAGRAEVLIKRGDAADALDVLVEHERVCRELGSVDGLKLGHSLRSQIVGANPADPSGG